MLTTFAWIFFRADNLGQACVYISRIATRVNPWALFNGTLYTMGLEQFEANVLFFALFILLLVDLVRYRLGRRVDVFFAGTEYMVPVAGVPVAHSSCGRVWKIRSGL